MNTLLRLHQLISDWASGIKVVGKTGKSLLRPSLSEALRRAGFLVDEEDESRLLQANMPVWRSKETWQIEPTKSRRRIDIVVYRDSRLVALIETESDLNDLRLPPAVTRRNGHYDVASISQSDDGKYFNSYKSIERMAAAAFFLHISQVSGKYPTAEEAQTALQDIQSDKPGQHNPSGLALYLVSGSSRPQDHEILVPRLRSLGATLISISNAHG